MARVLLTGAGGFVGSHILRRLLEEGHDVAAASFEHPERIPSDEARVHPFALDLADPDSIEGAFRSANPEVVVHAGAMADVNACEREPERSRRLNTVATRDLAMLCRIAGARLVFLSTDQVFSGARRETGDGRSEMVDGRWDFDSCISDQSSGRLPTPPSPLYRLPPSAYREHDEAHPVNVYGRTKLDAEEAIGASRASASILRLGLVFGFSPAGERSALEQLLAAGKRWSAGGAGGAGGSGVSGGVTVGMFTDEFRTPILAEDVASAVCELLFDEAAPLLHIAGPDRLSRYDFAIAAAEAFGLDPAFIRPALAADFEREPSAPGVLGGPPAPRPRDVSLDTRSARAALKRVPRPVVVALRHLARSGGAA